MSQLNFFGRLVTIRDVLTILFINQRNVLSTCRWTVDRTHIDILATSQVLKYYLIHLQGHVLQFDCKKVSDIPTYDDVIIAKIQKKV